MEVVQVGCGGVWNSFVRVRTLGEGSGAAGQGHRVYFCIYAEAKC